jgi:hypothetical protein
MGKHPQASHDPQLRQLLAQTAARLMSESGIRDFAAAKRKAALQHGVENSRNLPSNEEIETALFEYQRLFHRDTQSETLCRLRETALKAMTMLEEFQPCLVGPILNGSADENTPVYLHLFADTAEQVLLFLMERHIPYEQGERNVNLGNGRTLHYPKFCFVAGDTPIELTVFPLDGPRQPPLSPVDGKPMKRANRKQLEALLEAC